MSWIVSDVAITGDTNSTAICTQRKAFHGLDLFWVFYSDGINMLFKTSPDGENWSEATVIRACDKGYKFSIWWDGTYIHYAYSDGTVDNGLLYRRGQPLSGGTISWSAEQTARGSGAGIAYYYPMICVDTDGYPWIGYNYHYDMVFDWRVRAYVCKSSTKDGTWTEQLNKLLSDIGKESDKWRVALAPLTEAKMHCFYSREFVAEGAWENVWNGSSWDGQTQILIGIRITFDTFSTMSDSDDNVHLTYFLDTTSSWRYRKRTSLGVWGGGEELYNTAEWLGAPICVITPNLQYCISYKVKYKRGKSGSWGALEDVCPNHAIYCPTLGCFPLPYDCYVGIYWVSQADVGTVRFASFKLPVSEFDNQEDCERYCGYWWDGACHDNPEPEPTCPDYDNQVDCEAAGCCWCDGVCQDCPCPTPPTPPPPTPPPPTPPPSEDEPYGDGIIWVEN